MEFYYVVIVTLFALYTLGITIYSGYTADNNKPDSDSSDLFIVCYIICIIQCILYLICFFRGMYLGINNYPRNNQPIESDKNEGKNDGLYGFINLSLNIYWLIIHFNYDVSDAYNEFALVKTIEFFTILGAIIMFIFLVCCIGCCNSSASNNGVGIVTNTDNGTQTEQPVVVPSNESSCV